jgi:hypothetical protein
MCKHTPRMKYTAQMKNEQLKDYLDNHLKNELEWVLRAAAMWHVQRVGRLLKPGFQVHVFAMDSCFLHARALFEFFTMETTSNHYGCDQYLGKGTKIGSPRYESGWRVALHSLLMHAQNRSKPQKLTSFDGRTQKALKDMPVDFGKEIVRLWREFEESLGSHKTPEIKALQRDAGDILKKAIVGTEPIYKEKTIMQPEVKAIGW